MNQENSNDSSEQWWETRCTKCKQEFSESEPKLLPCLHTLCNSCVSADSTSNASLIICPLCRQDCKSDEVIVNQFIKEATSQNDIQKTENKISSCTGCEDDTAVTTSFCTDCSEWLCDACVQAHLRVRVTKDHTIQSREEVVGDQSTNVPQKVLFCPTHKQEPLKVFCESCDCLTCRDCQLSEHREHRYQFVSEASHHHKLYLQTLLEKLREKKTYMEAAKTLIGKRYKDIAEREQTVTNEIKMFAIRFITEINRRGKQLLAELHDVCGQKKAALGQKNTELTAMSEKLDHCLNFVESAISRSSDVALLYSKRTITNQLRNVLRSHCEVPNPNHVVDIRFVYENAFLSNYINQLGCLMVDNLPYHVRSNSFPSTHISPASVSSNNNNPSTASGSFRGLAILKKEMGLNMFGGMPNPNQPHVSSSTHPVDAQRNIRLRSLLEQAPAIPPHAVRSSGHFIPPSGIPKNHNIYAALYTKLVNNHAAGRVGNMWHNTVQKNSHLPDASNSVASSSGSINIHPGKIPQSMNTFNRSMPSQHPTANSLLSLSNTQRLSHYPALCSSAPAASVTTGTQELRMPSPQSSQSSPGINSASMPIQISNVISQKSSTSWHNNSKCVAPTNEDKNGKSQLRNMQNNVVVKQEVAPSNFPSCSVNRINIKQEINDDAQEIADTARHALRFFCDESSMSNIMGTLKSLNGGEGQHDSNNEVELVEGQNILNNNGSSVSPKNDESNQETDKAEKNSVQQADSSCSPGLLLVDCHTNDSSLENGLVANNKGISTDNESFNCNPSLDHDINSQLSCKINACHESQNQDPNDDWCAVCHDGGNLLCCGFCPRVYHLGCHIPTLSEFPGQEDQWQCLLCRNIDDIHKYIVKDISLNIKRKNPVGLSGHDLRLCERILLELFCHEFSSSFHHPVSRAEAPDYHKIINCPMDLSTIKKKLSPCHFNHYDDVQEFLDDFKLMFRNCFTYNEIDTVVYNAGKKLEDFFDELVNQYLPSYVLNPPANESEDEPPAKKKKADCVVIW